MTTYEPLDVKRVQTTSGGSHIEPPLQDTWSEIEKLRWHAGVVLVDSGVRVTINDSERYSVNGRDVPVIGIQVGNTMTSKRFDDAWNYLNGVSAGGQQASRAASTTLAEAQSWAAWFAAERDWNWHNENCGSICRCDRDWIEP